MRKDNNISAELSEKAAALAAETGCSVAKIIDRVLRSGVDAWEHEHRVIAAGLEQAERGEFASEEQIERVRNKYRPAT